MRYLLSGSNHLADSCTMVLRCIPIEMSYNLDAAVFRVYQLVHIMLQCKLQHKHIISIPGLRSFYYTDLARGCVSISDTQHTGIGMIYYYPHPCRWRIQYLVCVRLCVCVCVCVYLSVCLSVCYHKIAVKFNYLKI